MDFAPRAIGGHPLDLPRLARLGVHAAHNGYPQMRRRPADVTSRRRLQVRRQKILRRG